MTVIYKNHSYNHQKIWRLWGKLCDDGWRVSLVRDGATWCCQVNHPCGVGGSRIGSTPFVALSRTVVDIINKKEIF